MQNIFFVYFLFFKILFLFYGLLYMSYSFVLCGHLTIQICRTRVDEINMFAVIFLPKY